MSLKPYLISKKQIFLHLYKSHNDKCIKSPNNQVHGLFWTSLVKVVFVWKLFTSSAELSVKATATNCVYGSIQLDGKH